MRVYFIILLIYFTPLGLSYNSFNEGGDKIFKPEIHRVDKK